MAASLAWKAQLRGEPVAWILARPSSFFPPDLHAGGIDLEALAVVRVPDAAAAARAADKLLRSGAFGLVLLDDLVDRDVLGHALHARVVEVGGRRRSVETLVRDELVAVQTPQAFRRSSLVAAHAEGAEATDDEIRAVVDWVFEKDAA